MLLAKRPTTFKRTQKAGVSAAKRNRAAFKPSTSTALARLTSSAYPQDQISVKLVDIDDASQDASGYVNLAYKVWNVGTNADFLSYRAIYKSMCVYAIKVELFPVNLGVDGATRASLNSQPMAVGFVDDDSYANTPIVAGATWSSLEQFSDVKLCMGGAPITIFRRIKPRVMGVSLNSLSYPG